MEWQATDQFGNLFIGESDAQSFEDLKPHVSMLVDELKERAAGPFRVHFDYAYRELCGPDPERVSHVLRVPWLATVPKDDAVAEIGRVVAEVCSGSGADVAFTHE